MDTSSEYYVMGLEAEKNLKVKGNLLVCPSCNEIRIAHPACNDVFCRRCEVQAWNEKTPPPQELRRFYPQSQLQAMMDYRNMVELCYAFWEWFKKLKEIPFSMEKLWLCFAMHELHHKHWNIRLKTWEKREEG